MALDKIQGVFIMNSNGFPVGELKLPAEKRTFVTMKLDDVQSNLLVYTPDPFDAVIDKYANLLV